jgi:serine O-acetyltransferase
MKQSLLKEIKLDLQFAEKYSLKGFLLDLFFNSNFQALLSYRLQHRIAKLPRPFRWFVLPLKVITEYLCNCQIHYNAQIEGGIKLHHCVGVVIGGGVKIGKGTNILQNVTIGTKRLGVEEFPSIGRYVDIYSGAVIVGNIKIGDNVTIGANSVVLKDIPDNKVALGVPAIIF